MLSWYGACLHVIQCVFYNAVDLGQCNLLWIGIFFQGYFIIVDLPTLQKLVFVSRYWKKQQETFQVCKYK